eukprot:jgi/Mesen1/743/ME000110S_11015
MSRFRGFPNCVGALDVSHIECQKPAKGDPTSYWDKNCSYSICLQAVVGHNAMFLDVAIGAASNMHDERILRRSWLSRTNWQNLRLFRGPSVIVEDQPVPPYIVADEGYAPDHWLLVPFKRENNMCLSDEQKLFNTSLSSTRMVVERAFGILKGVWRMFGGRANHPVATGILEKQLRSCCILHNMQILVRCNPAIHEEWQRRIDNPPEGEPIMKMQSVEDEIERQELA